MPDLETLLTSIVGAERLIPGGSSLATPYLEEERGDLDSHARCIVLPDSTEEISQIVKTCGDHGVSVVPQGGNTGLVGGATAMDGQVLLSLKRLNRVRDLDALDGTMTVEAGCILADIQEVAVEAGRFFPVSLGAEGSCMIGGNISTNAGGINVLRYGNTRQQVLGLEVVLPDGRVWNGLNPLMKNNTGYDLKQLFIGAEGTLGVITAAVLRVYPLAIQSRSMLVGLRNLPDCLQLLALARQLSGDQVSSFELIPDIAMELSGRHIPGCKNPLGTRYPWYILSQFDTSSPTVPVDVMAESFVEQAFKSGWIEDAVLSNSNAQEQSLWKIREGIVAAQKLEGASVKHDVSVPVSRVPLLVEQVCAKVTEMAPGIRPYPFGHLGDGNLHFNLLQPPKSSTREFNAMKPPLHEAVYKIVIDLGGSFSAEHGVGIIKRNLMRQYKDPIELDLMRSIRNVIDRTGTMNPGKVV